MKKGFKFAMFKSGFGVSIQASERNYCSPRDDFGPYTEVELGFPNSPEPLIIGYAEDPDNPTETIYGYVPVGVVQALITKHGGMEEGEVPVFDMTPKQAGIFAEALEEI
jgi:hypothetical protein